MTDFVREHPAQVPGWAGLVQWLCPECGQDHLNTGVCYHPTTALCDCTQCRARARAQEHWANFLSEPS